MVLGRVICGLGLHAVLATGMTRGKNDYGGRRGANRGSGRGDRWWQQDDIVVKYALDVLPAPLPTLESVIRLEKLQVTVTSIEYSAIIPSDCHRGD